jgi:hypothetical protein
MSRADGVLVVVLKAQPFRDIEAGVKMEEYRSANWWPRMSKHTGICLPRLNMMLNVWHGLRPIDFHPYHTLRAFLGYAKDRPMIERPITHIDWGLPNPAWTYGIVSPGECFRIHLEPKP